MKMLCALMVTMVFVVVGCHSLNGGGNPPNYPTAVGGGYPSVQSPPAQPPIGLQQVPVQNGSGNISLMPFNTGSYGSGESLLQSANQYSIHWADTNHNWVVVQVHESLFAGYPAPSGGAYVIAENGNGWDPHASQWRASKHGPWYVWQLPRTMLGQQFLIVIPEAGVAKQSHKFWFKPTGPSRQAGDNAVLMMGTQ